MAKPEDIRCGVCNKPFATLEVALIHAQRQHGMTRQQAQTERKRHKR